MARPVAFITGSGRGTGLAIALRFARTGYDVAAAGRGGTVRAAATQLEAAGARALPLVCDVTDHAAVGRAVAATEERLGPIDVLVNNAGVAGSAPLVSMDDELWHRILAVNLTGTYHCMREVLPRMIERRGGRIINIASVAGKTGFPYTAAYCASKHGVLGLTRAVALEAAGKGVTINAICPGWLNTDMTQQSIDRIVRKTGRTPEEALATLERMNPQRRLIEADEVAALAVFLASPDARGINGQALSVDGGELVA
ncbi:MAG TPA: SDR family NAD(P)-dependent oxidoreductase [Vicinamibacterales bacterium]|nr:SDR family NAD(P)-dependent oxidoreductase [Vicinamibacterales bacterium]